MTTNNPEVVAHLYTDKEDSAHRGVSLFHDPSCTNTLIQREPLIRLSDYEARMAVLFDGHAVYSAMTDKAKQHTSPESVAAVLDAVVRLMQGKAS